MAATQRDQYRKPMPGMWYELERIFKNDGVEIRMCDLIILIINNRLQIEMHRSLLETLLAVNIQEGNQTLPARIGNGLRTLA